MAYPILYRKRIIPEECILLKDDIILHIDDDVIVTKWNALKPKKDLHHGFSCYFLNKGYKVSKFLREDGTLLYWYCDIVEHAFDEENNTYVFTDLLVDVIIYPDGNVKVVDLDEVATVIDKKLLTDKEISSALRSLDSLLNSIYDGGFEGIKEHIERFEKD